MTTPGYHIFSGVLVLIATTGCGPKSLATEAPPAIASKEPWVAQYLSLVESGCECKDSACLETAKLQLDQRLTEHGGLDEVPAEVNQGHGRFRACYQSGTFDPVRDHQLVTDEMCECTTESCVKSAMIKRLHLDDKYRDLADPATRDKIAEHDKRFAACREEKTLDAAKIAAHYEKTAAAVCACAQQTGCIGARFHELGDIPTAPVIVGLDDIKPRLDAALERICNCAINGGLATKIGGIQLTPDNCKALEKK